MAVFLRVDVDKPYGKHTLLRKILSKITEDFFPKYKINSIYLSHLKEFITFCNDNKIICTFYHRLCTKPDNETLELIKIGKHSIGLHLENSRSFETFKKEWNDMQNSIDFKMSSFSKHGSGFYKLGKYHYPDYEPQKYKSWAIKMNLIYPSGNGIPTSKSDLELRNEFYENVFWIEPTYRNKTFNNINDLIEIAKYKDVVVLIHPCNYIADFHTRSEFHLLVEMMKKNEIQWKQFENI